MERQEGKGTRGDKASGMQDDMPMTQCRRGRGGEEKTEGPGKGDRAEEASVILKPELSAWETQALTWKWALALQWLSIR